MLPFRTKTALCIEDFRVRLTDRPGWVWGTARLPQQGEEIFCAAGMGTVTALHGKTGDGSRLVQIGLENAVRRPFFAAASNVLLAPLSNVIPEDVPSSGEGPARHDGAHGVARRDGGHGIHPVNPSATDPSCL